jgi:hypothetical protein
MLCYIFFTIIPKPYFITFYFIFSLGNPNPPLLYELMSILWLIIVNFITSEILIYLNLHIVINNRII